MTSDGMRRLRVGLVGVGLIAQAEHAFYLWEERERFELVAVADPSAKAREGVGARYGATELHDGIEGLIGLGLDAVVIAAPDAVHAEIALAALDAGMHVFCEKPLALTAEDCAAVADRAEAAGLVVQVGTMKRYDPSFERLLETLPDDPADIRTVSIEITDPDFLPFVSHMPWSHGGDIDPLVGVALRAQTRAMAAAVAGREPTDAEMTAHDGYLGCLVHNLSLVHGIAAHYGAALPLELVSAAYWDEGRAVEMSVALPGGGRARMAHLKNAGVPDYRERMTVYCTDRIIELLFPSPYLRHFVTSFTVRTADGKIGLDERTIRVSYEEAFRSELRDFHAAITGGGRVRVTARDAAADVDLLVQAFQEAASGRSPS